MGSIMPELPVKIEEKFKGLLLDRFNPILATKSEDGYLYLEGTCPLCEEYFRVSCRSCPLFPWNIDGFSGCINFLDNILPVKYKDWREIVKFYPGMISWKEENNQKAVELLIAIQAIINQTNDPLQKEIVWI